MKEKPEESKVAPTPDPAPPRVERRVEAKPRPLREQFDEEFPSGTFRIPRI